MRPMSSGVLRLLEAFCIVGAAGALVLAIVAGGASGATACNNEKPHPCTFGQVHAEEDAFLNYDFSEENHSRHKVDWAIDLLFWNKSSVDNVKQILENSFPEQGNPAYSYLNNGFEWLWDEDSGAKTLFWNPLGDAYHFRIYASPYTDRFFNIRWGFYNIASAHIDHDEGLPWGWSGENEKAENLIAATWLQIVGARSVFHSWIPFQNYEEPHVEPEHHWWNNGKATKLRVPDLSEVGIITS